MTNAEKFILFVTVYATALSGNHAQPLLMIEPMIKAARLMAYEAHPPRPLFPNPGYQRECDGNYESHWLMTPELAAWDFVRWSLGLDRKPVWIP